MAQRSHFFEAIVDEEGNFLSGIQVSVFDLATGQYATIYEGKTGGATKSNPFVTDTQEADFFADPGGYRVEFLDTEPTARKEDWEVYWSAVSGENHGLALAQLPQIVAESDYLEASTSLAAASAVDSELVAQVGGLEPGTYLAIATTKIQKLPTGSPVVTLQLDYAGVATKVGSGIIKDSQSAYPSSGGNPRMTYLTTHAIFIVEGETDINLTVSKSADTGTVLIYGEDSTPEQGGTGITVFGFKN